MGLRDLSLKQMYRTDRDDLISEFFVPCLSNCIQYDRTIEYVSVKSITTLSLGFQNFADNEAKIRMVTGHRFRTFDLNFLVKLHDGNNNGRIHFKKNLIKDSKMETIQKIIQNNKFGIKIAIPNSEDVVGVFAEKIGIFRDSNDDIVAFNGTSNETFNAQNRNFESIDVFTSWDDLSRVQSKIKDFEDLWENNTKYVDIYDFDFAAKHNLLKYSTEWAVSLS